MTDTTTVLQSGNSQAVRLPKGFRFNTETVEILQRGDEVVSRETRRTIGDVIASLPPITDADAEELERTLADVRETRPAEERNRASLFDDDIPPGAPPTP